MSESKNKEKLLQTLESIDGTLKRLEQSICGKKSVVATPNNSRVVQMLEGQMELISAMSHKDDLTPEQLKSLSGEMDRIATTLLTM